MYGKQWRSWPTADGRNIDQLATVVQQMKQDPDSRRLVVSAWNVGELEQMALLPCHALFQFYVADRRLSCQLYQRSADALLGVPFNIASYALLTHMIAQQCELEVGDFVWTGGDCHLYLNHLEQADLQLSRTPYPPPARFSSEPRRVCSITHSRISRSSPINVTRRSKRRSPFGAYQDEAARARPPMFEVSHSPIHGYRRVCAAPDSQRERTSSSISAIGSAMTRPTRAMKTSRRATITRFCSRSMRRPSSTAASAATTRDTSITAAIRIARAPSIGKRVFIEALRTIQSGEELAYDYQIQRDPGDPADVDEIFACRCGAVGLPRQHARGAEEKEEQAPRGGTARVHEAARRRDAARRHEAARRAAPRYPVRWRSLRA